jgi:tetraacyldisaccharide-1-P 4'-kinase
MNAAITSFHGQAPVAWCRHQWEALHVHSAEGVARVPVEHLHGLKLVTCFGVAHPQGPRDQAIAAGARVVADIPAADHAPLGQAEVQAIESAARDADAVLVTGKDWVKLARVVDLDKFGVDIIVPDLSLVFTEGEGQLLERMLHAVSLEQT